MKKLIFTLFILFSLSSLSFGQITVSGTGCSPTNACFASDIIDGVWSLNGTDANGYNIYIDSAPSRMLIQFSTVDNEWKIWDCVNTTYYTNSNPTSPNPPATGWSVGVGECTGSPAPTLSGDVAVSCTEPDVPTVTATPSTVCVGGTSTLSISGSLNDATQWVIYSGSCGGTLLGSTTSSTYIVSPTANTTYYIRGEGGCTTPAACGMASVTVDEGEPRLVSADPNTGNIIIENCSATCPIDLTTWRLCSKFNYTSISAGMVTSGSLSLGAGASVTINWNMMDPAGADLGLYIPSGGFGIAANMEDFVQWGSAGNGRESVAVAKGIWDTGTFIGAPGAYTRSNCGMNKLVAWSGASISNTTTGCNSYTQTSVSGTNWTYFKDGSGNVVAGLNPNGVNLGDVMIQMDDMAAVPQDGLNLYYLPRYFNFESTLFDGIAMPFPSAVSIRLYFEGAELSSYNTDKGSAETMNDLSISHYSGGTEDCNILNNDDYDGTNVEFLTASANMYGVNSFSLQFDVNHFSEMGASGTSNGAIGLPIELTYFQAEKKGNTALLSWETASEENNLGFHIERSLDGQRFETISWIKGAGTAAEVQNYNFVDERPMTGINYYRLVQEDIDGTTSPSDIRKVEFGKKMSISLFPNPSKNGQGITLQIDAYKQGTTSINILDITGKQISSTSLELEAGMNNTTLEKDLAEGIYFLRLINNGAIQTLKFAVSH